MRLNGWVLATVATFCLAGPVSGSEAANDRMRPSIENLAQAKSIIVQTQMRVTRLIQKIAFGGGGG